MLSDIVKQILQEAAGDVAVIGGAVLLFNAITWKFKQMTNGLSSSDSTPPVNTKSGTGRRSNSGRGGGSAPAKPLRNADYYEGYRLALADKGVHVTQQQAMILHAYSSKKKQSLHYYAGYREGIKADDVLEYARMVQEEERNKRRASAYSYYGVPIH